MTAAQRNALRTIFRVAWNKRREDAAMSMSDALKAAWADHKAREAYFAQVAAAPAGSLRQLRFKSTVRTSGERRGRFYGNAARLSRGLYA
jgi:hypothetical protein